MRRILWTVAALAIVTGSTGADAKTASDAADEQDCRDYCAEMAARRCDDVTSSWCNAYILGCLAGCGVSGC